MELWPTDQPTNNQTTNQPADQASQHLTKGHENLIGKLYYKQPQQHFLNTLLNNPPPKQQPFCE